MKRLRKEVIIPMPITKMHHVGSLEVVLGGLILLGIVGLASVGLILSVGLFL